MTARKASAAPVRKDLSQKRVVDAIRARGVRYFVWDVARSGLGLDVWPSGKRSWVYQYMTADGVQRRMKIGDAAVMPPMAAGKALTLWQAELIKGGDPLATRRELKPTARAKRHAEAEARQSAVAERQAAATVADVAAKYLRTLERDRSERWATEARRIVTKIITPAIGDMLICDVSARDIRALKDSMASRPVMANATLRTLSTIFSRALADDDRPRALLNPVRDVERYEERARDRYLTHAEWPTMAKAITTMRVELETVPVWDTRRAQLDALLLLALTGARLNAVLPRRWTDFDETAKVLTVIPAHKGVAEIALGATARAHLNAIRARGAHSTFIFPGQRAGRRRPNAAPRAVASLNTLWRDLRVRAGVDDMTLHDWRRTFATVGGDVGVTDHMIGGLLGHAVPGVRGRYARRTSEALLAAADLVSAEIAKRLDLKVEAS